MIDPKYTALIEDINAYVDRKIDEEWRDSFGSMVLITAPRGMSLHRGDVTGWAAPELRKTQTPEQILMHSLFSLCLTLIGTKGIPPVAIHKLVMAAAVQLGASQVIIVDDDDALALLDDDDDIPQA